MITCKADMSGILSRLVKVAPVLRKPVRTLVIQEAKGFTKDAQRITPPASQGVSGPAAKAQGMAAIRRDLLGGGGGGAKFAGIFTVLPDALIEQAVLYNASDNVRLFVTKTGEVYGTEKALFRPFATVDQMYTHHRKYFKHGRMSQAGARTRDIGRWRFIDKMVVSQGAMNDYLKYVYEKVGSLASGLNAAAMEFGVPISPWIKRHGTRSGSVDFVEDDELRFMISITNAVSYAGNAGMQRRMDKVLEYRMSKLRRRLPYVVRYHTRKALLAGAAVA
jgi:hypothetical protein